MMLATRGGHIEAMRCLREDAVIAADLEVQNEQGQTALMLAVTYQHIDAVRLLQRYGASAFSLDHDGAGILAMGAKAGHDKIMKTLIEGVMATAASPEDVSKAAQNVSSLLSQPDGAGCTPLICAVSHVSSAMDSVSADNEAEQRALSCCKVIISDADGGSETINQANEAGDTPLICAARMNRPAVVEYLLEKGADPKHCNVHGITAQFLAQELGFDRVVEMCELMQAKLNAKS